MGNLILDCYGSIKKQVIVQSPFFCMHNRNIQKNPHQIDAFLKAVSSLRTGGYIFADEVGLGKTVEAGLVLKYLIRSGKKNIEEIDKKRNIESVDLVVTAPHSYSIKASPTSVEMKKLLESAKSQILITGYSISEYFDDLIDVIISKLQKGVVVKLYLNDFETKKEVLNTLLLYKGKFLQIFNYNKTSSDIDALHAKVISVDMKYTLIGSANLSLNGLQKNIEVGTIVESSRIANNISEMFNTLVCKKVFIRK